MREPNFGWSLPPGVSHKDIDRAVGADECEHGDDPGHCQDCREIDEALRDEAAERRFDEMKERGY